MKEFIAFFGEFIVVIAVSGIFYAMAPEGAQKKYIHFAISLCVLSAIVGPMLSVVSSLPEILENAEFEVGENQVEMESDLQDAVISASRLNIENTIRDMVSHRFGISEDRLDVSVLLNAENPENIEIVSVSIRAENTTHIKRKEIKEYLSGVLMEHCQIDISD